MSTLFLVGCGMVAWSVGALLIHTSRFTKVKDVVSGITIYKDKKTGKEYAICKNGYLKEL